MAMPVVLFDFKLTCKLTKCNQKRWAKSPNLRLLRLKSFLYMELEDHYFEENEKYILHCLFAGLLE